MADAEPTSKLIAPENKTIRTRSHARLRPEFSIASAPCTAEINPRLDHWNIATKWAAAKASTR